MISALLIHGVPIECINKAAITYYVPAKVIISVLNTEGGWNGLAHSNPNGTFDYGAMQVNSIWLNKIKPITRYQLQYNPCINVMVGTWILGSYIASAPSPWQGVGNYHSHSWVPNANYQNKAITNYRMLNHALKDD